ncbi:MAG TPA: DUF2064 domain-containing protein [Thermoanaerobaculia bacterium]|nr:DUF2064 domain-containing protein [Thermoanaerobaculia bacterium]
MSRAVLIFARSPRAEAAAKQLGRSRAPLFAAVARSWVRAAARCRAAVLVASAPEHRRALRSAGAWIEQRGETFGERLASSAVEAFAAGVETLLITGIDAPPPSPAVLDAGFRAVETGEAASVVSPSTDGGINFIVLRRRDVALLSGFAVGERDLVERCRIHFRDERCLLLETVSDVDSPEHLAALSDEAAWLPYIGLLATARRDWPTGGDAPVRRNTGSAASLRAPPARSLPAA